MNVIVCVKQVPDTTEIKIDPVNKTLIRAGVPSILNPFDAYAVEAALRMKDADKNTKVCVITMGPPQAVAVLREALSMGADTAYLCSSREFGGSDTLATSYILTNCIKKIEEEEGLKFDVIMCGKQAIDGDTAQVGPEIAEHMDYPQITYGLEVKEIGEDYLVVTKELDDGKAVIKVHTPCVCTFTLSAFEPRYPTVRGKMAANRAQIPTLSAAEVTMDLTRAGLKGSPTKVKKTFTPEVKTGGIRIDEGEAKADAIKLAELLHNTNVI